MGWWTFYKGQQGHFRAVCRASGPSYRKSFASLKDKESEKMSTKPVPPPKTFGYNDIYGAKNAAKDPPQNKAGIMEVIVGGSLGLAFATVFFNVPGLTIVLVGVAVVVTLHSVTETLVQALKDRG